MCERTVNETSIWYIYVKKKKTVVRSDFCHPPMFEPCEEDKRATINGLGAPEQIVMNWCFLASLQNPGAAQIWKQTWIVLF